MTGNREYKPLGKKPLEDLNLLANLISEVADLFEQGGAVVWLNNGTLVPLGKTNLAEIIRTNIVIKCLKEEGPILKPKFLPLEINDRTIATLLREPKENGGLIGRVPQLQYVLAYFKQYSNAA